MKALKNVLLVIAIYMAVLGVLFLFAPSVARVAFQLELPDAGLNQLYGQVLLAIALTVYLISTDVTKYAQLVWVPIFVEGGHILVFGYQLMTGISSFAQVGPPMIIAIIFTVLLFVFKGKA